MFFIFTLIFILLFKGGEREKTAGERGKGEGAAGQGEGQGGGEGQEEEGEEKEAREREERRIKAKIVLFTSFFLLKQLLFHH